MEKEKCAIDGTEKPNRTIEELTKLGWCGVNGSMAFGHQKKRHYHFVFCWKHTPEQVAEFIGEYAKKQKEEAKELASSVASKPQYPLASDTSRCLQPEGCSSR
jgi:hypothetical protein